MSDELQRGVSGVSAGTGPEQPEPTAEEQQQASAAPAIDLSKINLEELPQYQAVRGKLQSHADRARNEAEAAKREAELAKREREQVLNAIKSYDPKMAESVEAQLAAHAVQAERDYYKEQFDKAQAALQEQQAIQAYDADLVAWARDIGLDPASAEVQQARAQHLSGDDLALERLQLKVELRREMQGGVPPSTAPASQEAPQQVQAQGKPRPNVGILPPSGGSAAAAKLTDDEHSELQKLYGEPTKNAARIRELESRLGR